MKLVLASASPRRRELLSLLTRDFDVCVSQVDEGAVSASNPAELARRLAFAKCSAVAHLRPKDVVIGCDTVVDVDGRVLGKPRDADDARTMLWTLSGRTHRVHTGVCILAPGERRLFCSTTRVTFWPLAWSQVEQYLATDEPYDKAGAYGIQGGAAAFVRGIQGCYFNVVGLPVSRLDRVLRSMNCWRALHLENFV